MLCGERRVECCPEDALQRGAGWVLTWADTESGEWNLAHPFGSPLEYRSWIPQITAIGEFHLLIPQQDVQQSIPDLGANVREQLIWHADPEMVPEGFFPVTVELSGNLGPQPLSDDQDLSHLPAECSLTWREAPEPVKSEWRHHAYILSEGSIACLVKPIRVTPGTVEVYVETVPNWRDHGLATKLLTIYLQRLRQEGKCLLYVVSDQNVPSMKVAANLGLRPYQTLFRIFQPSTE